MAYEEPLQSAVSSLIAAGESGRTHPRNMMDSLGMALSGMTVAADALERTGSLNYEKSVRLRRLMSAAKMAHGTAIKMASKEGQAAPGATLALGVLDIIGAQAGRAGVAANRMARVISSSPGILPSSRLEQRSAPSASAVKPFPHLLILQPLDPQAKPYYFNLDTAAFDELRRQTGFRWASQERLARRPAQQAVGQGDDKITLKGAIFPASRGGLGQLQALRNIGRQLQPLSLITGYGEVLGNWCLTNIDEEQGSLLAGGIPRKQGFTLEFVSYGDDLQNV